MSKVFISYNKADRQWAEWIGWQLEENKYTVILQAWDFKAGSNFVLEMQKAAIEADHTIAVLSDDYLGASFTQPEWAAAFARDPRGEKGILIPVRVRECDVEGMLGTIIYIDLVGLDEKKAAEVLIKKIKRERLKPDTPPAFPGGVGSLEARTFSRKPAYPMDNISLSRLPVTGDRLFGREKELKMLDEAWADCQTDILTLVAWGGVGKTALVNQWLNRMKTDNYLGA
ncbi:MAG: hypothetical protein QG657_3224, partial [Acidobacteriota bacterium]|nr:hypothetical protein [Acidobacteriota bacterium]